MIAPVSGGSSTGGRPSSRFELNSTRAILLTADIGASGFIVAACDLVGRPIRHTWRGVDVGDGPDAVLTEVQLAFNEVRGTEDLWGIGIGVPGPVEFAAGRVVSPPIMTGWDNFDINSWFNQQFGVTVIVENDANARAVAESRLQKVDSLISLKVGTGIGSGLVFNGQIIRGSDGAAGDIGHTGAANIDSIPLQCRCGNVGCVEAYAGGWALVRDLRLKGLPATSVSDVVELLNQGNSDAVAIVRQAGRVLGEAVADLVSILNPSTIIVSGKLAECGAVLLSGVRERVYQRALPLATRNLTITTSTLGKLAGVTGLALITADRIFGADSISELLTPAQRQSSGQVQVEP
jgi:predicted NBD/HSP70 family sugar kinase